ncbi:MAG: hypothetical protein OI717_00520 (plasmid) [Candidatus Methanoperedens sp.]|nr:MAG: hypothetical protein OI717_00520 [Candidatus Methanoperedens sp.]
MSIIAKITGFFKKNPQNSEKDELIKSHSYIGKFVKQDNTDIGESIGVEGKRIIIKNPENIMSIPIEAIIKNAQNIIVGDFDREEATRLGKEWADQKDMLVFDDKGMLVK